MIYKINIDQKENGKEIRNEKVTRVAPEEIGLLEKDLENYIANNIAQVLPTTNLMTIFQERQRQEEPDIMALNENGDLYIFELKRFSSKEDDLLQLLRYAQKFGDSDYKSLNDKYSNYVNNLEGKSLLDIHKETFGNDEIKKEDINQKQHLYIITNGVDEDTINKIKLWEKNGLKINVIVYWIFSISNEYYIEFNVCHDLEALIEYEEKYYIVNTNKTWSPQTTESEDLIKNKKVAIQGKIKYKINTFNKNDRIYLYENRKGIIATGIIKTGITKESEWNGEKGEEWYMELTNFEDISSKPIKADIVSEICDKNFYWATTFFSISKENSEKIQKEIENRLSK